jgi:hypothetical protein
MTASPVRIAAGGISTLASGRRLEALKRRFERRWLLRLPGLLEPALLAAVSRDLAASSFRENRGKGLRAEAHDFREIPRDRALGARLLFLLNDPRLFGFVEEVAGCAPIGSISGGLYRSSPGRHYLAWHGDYHDGDVVAAMAINLSPAPFAGGRLRIKRRGAGRIHHAVSYRRPGEAVLIAVGPDLLHSSAALRGNKPKVVFSCLFHRAALPPPAASRRSRP